MATTARKPAATKADALNLSKPSVAKKTAAKRGTTYLPGTAIPADLKPVKRAAKAPAVSTTATRRAIAKEAVSAAPKAATKPVATKRAAALLPGVKAAKVKKPSTAVKFRGFLIPVTRKNGTDGLDVPTIQLSKVSDISKLFALLPKGCTVDTYSTQQINLFNKSGALIAEIRTNK